MRTITILCGFLILLSSCGKPSYKKNEILSKSDSTATESILDEVVVFNQVLTTEEQIATALLAAPEDSRDKAKVYGYDASGEWMTLREGSNEFICIADNPNQEGFQAVCYHKSLEPMMARGRELAAEGKSRDEKEAIRAAEAESGKLALPEAPAALHIYFGKNAYYNQESGLMENVKYRYVVYTPYATKESTGLPLAPNAPHHPWLMFPGKYNAHIMISPEN